jgi:unsaturated chondroitin disaccharide hydrolase
MRDIMPYTTENGRYIASKKEGASWWTNGFYGGMMWLMYNATQKDIYKKAASKQEKLLDEALRGYDGLHHDVGFMWGLTSKAQYILTGDRESRVRALYAANLLAARVNIKGGFIRAWDLEPSYSIIDCMMNIPLLYWASRELEDNRFKYIAQLHADMAMYNHVRDDGSVVHIAVHAEERDEVVETLAGQGYAVGSAWSRGQAWAVYGFILSYIHTGEEKYLETAKRVADYFLEHSEKSNYKVVADFNAPETPVYYDNTAGACAACGLIEIYKSTKDKKYLSGAIKILYAMEEDCIFDDSDESILQNCMESYSAGKEMHIIYGDFFLCEAILKLRNEEFLIW